jgi:hypothetical protein
MHLFFWFRQFPAGDYHCFAGPVGEYEEECLLCGATQCKTAEDIIWEHNYLARRPERLLRNAGEALLRRFLVNLTRLGDEDLRVLRQMRNALEKES